MPAILTTSPTSSVEELHPYSRVIAHTTPELGPLDPSQRPQDLEQGSVMLMQLFARDEVLEEVGSHGRRKERRIHKREQRQAGGYKALPSPFLD